MNCLYVKRLLLPAMLFLTCITTAGCGEAYRDQAVIYTAAAESALIANGVCANADDCTRRQVLFWEGGNPWIPSLKRVFINIYGIKDPTVVTAVSQSISRSRANISGPPCTLTTYSTEHNESKVKLSEVVIQ